MTMQQIQPADALIAAAEVEAARRPIRVTLVVEYDALSDLADGAQELQDNAMQFGDLVSMKVSIPGGDYDWKG